MQLQSMKRADWRAKFGAILLAGGCLMLSACGLLGDQPDETASWSANKLYSEAKDALDGGDYTRAVKLYEKLEGRYPFGRFAQQAQIDTAYANYKDGETAAALAAVDRFIQLHPSHPNIDYAYYLKGLINFNDNLGWLGRFSGQDLSERDPKAARAAYDAFQTLVTRYPDSKYTPDATLRMQYIVNSLAQHEVHAARYYYRRGAYLAAVNRAQQSLKDYDGAPANEEALYIMVRSYDALGMKDLRDDAARVMERNYPNSDFIKYGQRRKDKSWWEVF
ncbi:MAG: outer membrane protein assembly factor BamD [Cupriavidus sp.]|jgi:outer membrane protein assembly factor BamD|uniref:outer membrane protein assembly factor BamD n=1 Tax=Cupriavidus pauculus TaxID=82633 RepID=UPI0007813BB7|nr:outer membrane protein assembly factor BamD [Cupriavidus pauculus]MBU66269.1 outer membrane protein assembly factor BamD [Cupriavidus sp.]KAB0604997.1 outer membrane protein assembly factor BamD [Cupriavidus pauculus]MBY4729398.1 outer membrane protein assembly factor BamD [Cupriavidus pauculus]MCM3604884.1 outer membrane protein assembly factor BamD [Cupriavidus pauculus]UAK99354.1 outer membrane protein assembly factor BamD [Cupriavidus pauculus]